MSGRLEQASVLRLVCGQCRAISHPLEAEWLDAVHAVIVWSWACEHVPEHVAVEDLSWVRHREAGT